MSLTKGKSNALAATPYDIQMMLSCNVHVGTKNVDKQMEKYVHARRKHDGSLFY